MGSSVTVRIYCSKARSAHKAACGLGGNSKRKSITDRPIRDGVAETLIWAKGDRGPSFPGFEEAGNKGSRFQGVQEPGRKSGNPATGREAVRFEGGEGPPVGFFEN